MVIERKADQAFAEELFRDMKRELAFFLGAARKDPKNLSLLISTAWNLVSCGCVAEPQSPEIPKALNIVADAYCALFALALNHSRPVTVRLGEGEPVIYTQKADESSVNVGAWIGGFYFNVICRKSDSIDLLCRLPVDVVRRSSTKAGEYHYRYMESLQALGNGKLDDAVKIMLAAINATDPKRQDIFDSDWTLYLHVPQLEVLIYLVTRDPKFGDALGKAVQLHKKYWEKTKDRKRDYHGLISIELTALAKMGRDRGLAFDVESPYLAMNLVK